MNERQKEIQRLKNLKKNKMLEEKEKKELKKLKEELEPGIISRFLKLMDKL